MEKGLFDLSKYTQQQQEQEQMLESKIEDATLKSFKSSSFDTGVSTGDLAGQIRQSAQANPDKKTFLCLYEGNRFFDSFASALDWLNTAHANDQDKWRVVEITAEPVAQRLSDAQHAVELDAAYSRGTKMERKLQHIRLSRKIQEILDELY